MQPSVQYLCSFSSVSSASSNSEVHILPVICLAKEAWECCGQTCGSASICLTCVCLQRPRTCVDLTVASRAFLGTSWWSLAEYWWLFLQLTLFDELCGVSWINVQSGKIKNDNFALKSKTWLSDYSTMSKRLYVHWIA